MAFISLKSPLLGTRTFKCASRWINFYFPKTCAGVWIRLRESRCGESNYLAPGRSSPPPGRTPAKPFDRTVLPPRMERSWQTKVMIAFFVVSPFQRILNFEKKNTGYCMWAFFFFFFLSQASAAAGQREPISQGVRQNAHSWERWRGQCLRWVTLETTDSRHTFESVLFNREKGTRQDPKQSYVGYAATW